MTKDPRGKRRYMLNNRELRDSLPPVCSWCGEFVDVTLHYNNPMAWTTDHTVALADGGDLYGDRTLMHRRCNAQKEGERRRRMPDLPPPDPTSTRLVVLLCGPPGAGKTTAAVQSGLTVYDRDDERWTSEAQFSAALRMLGTEPGAHAVVIRAAPDSATRTRTAALIQATHTYLVTAPRAELAHRIALRGRQDTRQTHAALSTWHRRFDDLDGVQPFPGWEAISVPATPLRTTRDW